MENNENVVSLFELFKEQVRSKYFHFNDLNVNLYVKLDESIITKKVELSESFKKHYDKKVFNKYSLLGIKAIFLKLFEKYDSNTSTVYAYVNDIIYNGNNNCIYISYNEIDLCNSSEWQTVNDTEIKSVNDKLLLSKNG